MRKILGLSVVLAAALLSGCGEGALYGDPPAETTTTTPAATMVLQTSSTTIPSDGATGAIITAIVRGANNEFLENVPINFSASSGGLSLATATTDQNGSASTTLTAAGDPVNRTITVTASNGPVTLTVNVDVTGTVISLGGPSSLVLGGAPGIYTATLVDSGGNGLSGRPVLLTTSTTTTITPGATVTTDAFGNATFNVAATGAGVSTFTASSIGVSFVKSVNVSSDSFLITAPAAGASINLGQVVNVDATWTIAGAPQVGQTINFATTRGTLSAASAVTNGAGVATVTLSSVNAGPANLQATTPAGPNQLTAQRSVSFVATTPASLVLQASPSNVPTTTSSTITAIVRDAAGNLVQGQTVNFSLSDVTGGNLSLASATTDSQGRATTIYTASSSTSASNGVVITATIPGTAVTGQTSLTVGGRSVFISLGTGNSINEPNQTQYYIEYSAQALDAAGNALDGIQVSFTLHALDYRKGFRFFPFGGSRWVTQYTTPSPYCANEDINLNGVLDLVPVTEDISTDGRLTPGDIGSVSPGSLPTTNGGTATVRITYPQNYAYWIRARLTATAVVQGTQTSSAADFLLPGATSDFANASVEPPGVDSPFGGSANCNDVF